MRMPAHARPAAAVARMRQVPLPIAPELPCSFDSFVAGTNAPALVLLAELAEEACQGTSPPPVYLWGPAGCGKSHLLQALAGRVQALGGKAGHFDAVTPLPWELDEDRHLTVLDQCDRFDPARQQAAFALFVDASARGTLVAGAGVQPPVDLPLRDDLRTRLGWGHVIALQPLSDEDTLALLRQNAKGRGYGLSDELAHYVLSHFPRDPQHLMALMERVERYSLEHQRPLTVPLLKQMLLTEPLPAASDHPA